MTVRPARTWAQLAPTLYRLSRVIVFVAVCPACGSDALWRSEATAADPRPVVEIRCQRCDPIPAETPSGARA